MDTQYAEFESPKEPQFFKFEMSDVWYRMKFLRQLADSENFEIGPKGKKKPAPVWLIEHNGDEYRLTLTSAHLRKCLDWLKNKTGKLEGIEAEFMPVGKDKERTYRVRIAENAQSKITAA